MPPKALPNGLFPPYHGITNDIIRPQDKDFSAVSRLEQAQFLTVLNISQTAVNLPLGIWALVHPPIPWYIMIDTGCIKYCLLILRQNE
jgi:hypothetical protein